jgi:hypothetical protein
MQLFRSFAAVKICSICERIKSRREEIVWEERAIWIKAR